VTTGPVPEGAESLVTYRREGAVVFLCLNRPEKLNAINDDLVRALRAALAQFDQDVEARVAVLHGAGRAFSSGADVKQNQLRSREEMERFGGTQAPGADATRVMYESVNWKPVVVACHGYVLGAAFGWVLSADLAVADDTARFQVTEVRRGGSGARLWGLMALRGSGAFAGKVALTGEVFDAQSAAAQGLIHEVVPAGEHLRRATELAVAIATHPPLSVRLQVRALRLRAMEVDDGLTRFAEPYRLHLTRDYEKSARAVASGEEPTFTGE
jgi:enoyl-CoA hydratase/carnithine racemase